MRSISFISTSMLSPLTFKRVSHHGTKACNEPSKKFVSFVILYLKNGGGFGGVGLIISQKDAPNTLCIGIFL